jgi:hypothetical protein
VADLYSLADFDTWVGSAVDSATSSLIRRVVTGLFVAEIGPLPVPVPDGLMALGLQVGGRLLEAPTGLRAESFAGYSATYGSSELSEAERKALRRAISGRRAYSVRVPVFYATETDD